MDLVEDFSNERSHLEQDRWKVKLSIPHIESFNNGFVVEHIYTISHIFMIHLNNRFTQSVLIVILSIVVFK